MLNSLDDLGEQHKEDFKKWLALNSSNVVGTIGDEALDPMAEWLACVLPLAQEEAIVLSFADPVLIEIEHDTIGTLVSREAPKWMTELCHELNSRGFWGVQIDGQGLLDIVNAMEKKAGRGPASTSISLIP